MLLVQHLPHLTKSSCFCKIEIYYGGIAQLGERLNGIQEVSGSIPLISTITESVKKTSLL